MVLYTLKSSIVIDPTHLGKEFETVLHNKLTEAVVGTCDREHGYIISIREIVNYENFISNATSQIIFSIVYVAECMKPNIGDQADAEVLSITSDGIFCVIHNRCKTLIPMTKLHDRYCRIVSRDGVIVNKENKNDVIQAGSQIRIEIVNTRYDNKQYSCIAVVI